MTGLARTLRLLALLALGTLAGASVAVSAEAKTRTPIKHFLVLMHRDILERV